MYLQGAAALDKDIFLGRAFFVVFFVVILFS